MSAGPTRSETLGAPASGDAIPRLAYEELPPEVADALRDKVQRLGYLGEFFQCGAHQPGTLAAFIEFTDQGRAALGPRLTEVVALTASTHLGSDYEKHQHERLSVRLGYGRDWVAAVERLDPASATELSQEDRDVQQLALEALRRIGRGSGPDVARFSATYGPERAVATLFVTARYLAHGMLGHAFELTPPVPSVFEDGFDV
jgi:alkylhydroperoxidase family enzyme